MGQSQRLFFPTRQLDRLREQRAALETAKADPSPDAKSPPTTAIAQAGGKEVIARCPERIKRKNIVFIASECHYDDFWWKMMFVAPGYSAAGGGGIPQRIDGGVAAGATPLVSLGLRWAELTTVAYVDQQYTRPEKLPIERLRDHFKHQIVVIKKTEDIFAVMNDLPEQEENGCQVKVKLQDVAFFSHGLPSNITLNYENYPHIELTNYNYRRIKADAFVPDGRIYSYACRTGTYASSESFNNSADAEADKSLAQKLANYLNISVYAFMVRSHYRPVLRDPADSTAIAAALKSKRKGHELEILSLSAEHEALPHPGLGNGFWGLYGNSGEGTKGFALWRKQGARAMPVGHDTPTGLPQDLREYKPAGAP